MAQKGQPDESTGLLRGIHADAEIHAHVEQVIVRTVSETVPMDTTDDDIGLAPRESGALPDCPVIMQNSLTTHHSPTYMDTPYQGEYPLMPVDSESYHCNATHCIDMNRSNNNAAGTPGE